MSAELLSLVSTQMNLTPKLGILVALLSCVPAVSLNYTGVSMVPTEEEFNLLDSDNDGEVSRQEFVERHLEKDELLIRYSVDPIDLRLATTEEAEEMMRKASSRHEKVIEKVFDSLDKNDDGVLSPKEYMNQWTLTEFRTWILDATFETLDQDGDGVVSQDEFVSAMKLHFKSDIALFDELEPEIRSQLVSFRNDEYVRQYNRVDANDDGRVTRTEIEAEQNWLKKIGYDASVSQSSEERPRNSSDAQKD